MFVQGTFEGDFLLLLLPIEETDSMAQVAEKLAHHVVERRVAKQDRPMRVVYEGREIPAETTVAEAGISHWDYVEVAYA